MVEKNRYSAWKAGSKERGVVCTYKGGSLIATTSGKVEDNCVDPMVLKDRERDRLREALRGVDTSLNNLKSRHQLDMMAR